MIELEVKFAVSKIPDSLIKNVPVAEKEQLDIYYDTFDYQLLKGGNFLRIRNEEKLDFKLDLGDDSHLFCEETSFDREKLPRKKKELELIFNRLGLSFNSDFTDLTGFLEKNGLTVLAPVKKKRKEYKINEINITLDDVEDLGIYIEAEKIFETELHNRMAVITSENASRPGEYNFPKGTTVEVLGVKGKNAKVINKSLAEDDLQITSVNYNEVCHAAKKSSIKAERKNKKPRMTYEATVEGLNTIVRRTRKKKVIPLTVPPDAELKKRYRIRDASDRKIIYAADVTGTEILVTEDKDYYAENAEIPDKIRVMHADTYLDEERRGFSLSKLLRRRK